MNIKFLILIILASFTCIRDDKQFDNTDKVKYVYWNDLTNSAKDSVLSCLSTNDNILKYYQNKFQLLDNKEMFNLLDSIDNWFNKSKVFYFYVFNIVCEKSDGAFSEILGIYCMDIILNDPNYVFNYFRINKNIERLYAQLMGSEFYFKESGTSIAKYNYAEFKNKIDVKVSGDNESIKREFYNLIEKTMGDMN